MGRKANERQVGGNHYKCAINHWDFVMANEIPYMEAVAIKYLTRWRKKEGAADLAKAFHFLQRSLEDMYPQYDLSDAFDNIITTLENHHATQTSHLRTSAEVDQVIEELRKQHEIDEALGPDPRIQKTPPIPPGPEKLYITDPKGGQCRLWCRPEDFKGAISLLESQGFKIHTRPPESVDGGVRCERGGED